MKKVVVLFFLMFLIVTAESRAQTVAPEKQKGKKILVSVPVSVSDREGRYISGLKEEDFALYQDGVQQEISFFATEDEPIIVALVIDTSESTAAALEKIKQAAEDFIDLLNPNDKCQLATFDSRVNILSPLTSDRKTLKKSLESVQTAAQEGSVLLRAVEQIARNSFTNVQGRKVIVLLSDGKDFGSALSKNELLNRLEESDILIYSIFYQTGAGFEKLVIEPDGTVKEGKQLKPKKPKKPKKSKGYSIFIPLPGDVNTEEEIKLASKAADIDAVNFLKEMSDTTAGRFYPSSTPDLEEVFKKIAAELRQQYRLGFYTRDAAADDVSVLNISVKVKRPEAVVRARGKFRKPL